MTSVCRSFVLSLLAVTGTPWVVSAADSVYHHVHLAAPDAAAAAGWYIKHLGCEGFGRSGACRVGDVQFIFFDREPEGGSVGSGVDHIGFSFADLEAKMAGWRAAGVTVLEDVREIDGLFKLAFIEDPWGTKIEVVEDQEDLGFHHLHLRSPDPEATLAWYQDVFGGETDAMKGRINGLRWGRVWLLVSRVPDGDASVAPTQGRSVDHLGWGVEDLEAFASETKAKGIAFQMDPRPITNSFGQDLIIAFILGPDDVRIEIVESVS